MKGVLKKDGLVDCCAGGETMGGEARGGGEAIGFDTARDCSLLAGACVGCDSRIGACDDGMKAL